MVYLVGEKKERTCRACSDFTFLLIVHHIQRHGFIISDTLSLRVIEQINECHDTGLTFPEDIQIQTDVCVVSALLCYHKNQSLWGSIIRHCLWFFSLIIWDNKLLDSYPDWPVVLRINHAFMLMNSTHTFSSLKYSRWKSFVYYMCAQQFCRLPI